MLLCGFDMNQRVQTFVRSPCTCCALIASTYTHTHTHTHIHNQHLRPFGSIFQFTTVDILFHIISTWFIREHVFTESQCGLTWYSQCHCPFFSRFSIHGVHIKVWTFEMLTPSIIAGKSVSISSILNHRKHSLIDVS